LNLYYSLENEDRTSISLINYKNALRSWQQIYEKIAMEEYESLKDGCSQAKNYDNILKESYFYNNSSRKERIYFNNYNIINNNNVNDSVDDLVNKIENLLFKSCYICRNPGRELACLQKDPNFINYIQKN